MYCLYMYEKKKNNECCNRLLLETCLFVLLVIFLIQEHNEKLHELFYYRNPRLINKNEFKQIFIDFLQKKSPIEFLIPFIHYIPFCRKKNIHKDTN